MQVFYVNVGGGEPTVRPDFWHLLDYAVDHQVGVKFSTNGIKITPRARRVARGHRLRRRAGVPRRRHPRRERRRTRSGLVRHRDPRAGEPGRGGLSRLKISVVVTRHNVGQLDEFKALADRFGAHPAADPVAPVRSRRRRVERAAPDRGGPAQLYDWLLARGEGVLTGDSFFHLAGVRRIAARAEPLRSRAGGVPDRPGRGRLRLPVRDPRRVPAPATCSTVAGSGGCGASRRCSPSCATAERRGVRVVHVLRQLPGRLHGGEVLHRPAAGRAGPRVRARVRRGGAGSPVGRRGAIPKSEVDHSRSAPRNSRTPKGPVPLALSVRPPAGKPDRACDESPLAGFALPAST